MASSDLIAAPKSTNASHPFDAAASSYDASFTETPLGRWYRNQVWNRLTESFQPGDHVLDLGCGTGEDAIWLARRGVHVTATDASTAMLEIARGKAVASGDELMIRFSQVDLNEIDVTPLPNLGEGPGVRATYDGAYSNFGPLNCLEDRRPLANALANAIKPGGRLMLVVMGPICPWEMLWHTARLELGTAFRRFRSGVPARIGDDDSLRVWYPSIGRLESEFHPHFKTIEKFGLGLFVPPTAMDGLVQRAPRIFSKLAVIDGRAGHLRPWLWCNDHYMLVMERQAS